jgi:L-alanine-DL-glutamate epimerase-like enolase superfamily enzyme
VPEKLHFKNDLIPTSKGPVTLPEKPGFGIELDQAKINKQEVLTSV